MKLYIKLRFYAQVCIFLRRVFIAFIRLSQGNQPPRPQLFRTTALWVLEYNLKITIFFSDVTSFASFFHGE